jgi:nucleoside-diphosphate-sugar epimerase
MNNPIHIFKGRNFLVTGGAGYLATNLIAQLQDTECRITRLDRPGVKFIPVRGKAQVRDVEGDIRDRAVWEKVLANVDIVFHFAAQTSVYVAEQNPSADLDINVVPMLHLLETCREKGICPTILFSGTVTEVGLPASLPVNESHPDHPITVYDLHKWLAENYLKHYVRGGIVRGAVLRLANVYGPGPRSSSADRGVLNMMIHKALNGETLTIYGKGDYLRDYVYVDDVVRAFLYGAANLERVNGQYFVIGTGEKHTIAEALDLIAERVALKSGTRVPVVHVDMPASLPPIETRNFVADIHRFNEATGWLPTYSLTAGVDRTIENYIISS